MDAIQATAAVIKKVFESFTFPNVGFLVVFIVAFVIGLLPGNSPYGIPCFGKEHMKYIAIGGSLLISGVVLVAVLNDVKISMSYFLSGFAFLGGMLTIAWLNGRIFDDIPAVRKQ